MSQVTDSRPTVMLQKADESVSESRSWWEPRTDSTVWMWEEAL